MDNPLDEMKDYSFDIKGGQQVIDGKSYYPVLLRVNIPHESLLETAMQLLNRLQYPGEGEVHQLALFGSLEDITDQD